MMFLCTHAKLKLRTLKSMRLQVEVRQLPDACIIYINCDCNHGNTQASISFCSMLFQLTNGFDFMLNTEYHPMLRRMNILLLVQQLITYVISLLPLRLYQLLHHCTLHMTNSHQPNHLASYILTDYPVFHSSR